MWKRDKNPFVELRSHFHWQLDHRSENRERHTHRAKETSKSRVSRKRISFILSQGMYLIACRLFTLCALWSASPRAHYCYCYYYNKTFFITRAIPTTTTTTTPPTTETKTNKTECRTTRSA